MIDELPGGLCPTCLMAAARQSQEEFDRTKAVPGSFETPSISQMARLFPELEIIQFVGRGGMGAVFKVRQKNLDRIVALKVFLDRPDDPEFAARFQREARALARLNHPNIVTVHDFGVRDEVHYLVMEFIDGVNLRQLTVEERLSPEMALQMVPQLCDALQYAHDNGVIHRDIKPENLLLDTNGRINIADFGLAKMTGSNFNGTLTRTQQVMGTFNYMAPEQRERPTEVDHRADIYSLGVVIYELLTGELPIGRFQPPSSKSKVNGRLDDVVMRALEKEPERRYQQVSDFKTGFQSVGDFSPLAKPVPPVKAAGAAAFAAADSFDRPRGTRTLVALMSGQTKKGTWKPGQPQLLLTCMGAIDIDLRDVEQTEVSIVAFTLMGGTEIIVPHGAVVDLDGFMLMGATDDKVERRPNTPPRMHVRIRSWGAMGGFEVRTPTAKETRAEEIAKGIVKDVPRVPSGHEVSVRGFIMLMYKLFALLVTFAVPAIFVSRHFNFLPSIDSKIVGIVVAIFAGFLWCWTDYLRVLIGAGPAENDAESVRKYHSQTKLGTLIRSVGLLFGFLCPTLFVAADFHGFEDYNAKFAAICCGILCAALFAGADHFEEFFYGNIKK